MILGPLKKFLATALTPFPESGSRKHFHASGMHAIDSPHKITPIGIIFRKNFLKKIHLILCPFLLRVPKIFNKN